MANEVSILSDYKIIVVISSAAVATITSVITVWINNRQSKKNLLQQKELFTKQLEFQSDQFNKERKELLKDFNKAKTEALKETFLLLSKLYSSTSYTISYIESSKGDVEAFNKYYRETILELINQLSVNIGLYFHNLSKDLEKLNSNGNLYWGYQNMHIENKSEEVKKEALNNILSSSRIIYETSKKMQDELKKEFEDINN